jgi:hypothetical protein
VRNLLDEKTGRHTLRVLSRNVPLTRLRNHTTVQMLAIDVNERGATFPSFRASTARRREARMREGVQEKVHP